MATNYASQILSLLLRDTKIAQCKSQSHMSIDTPADASALRICLPLCVQVRSVRELKCGPLRFLTCRVGSGCTKSGFGYVACLFMSCQNGADPYHGWFLIYSSLAETILRFSRCQASSRAAFTVQIYWIMVTRSVPNYGTH